MGREENAAIFRDSEAQCRTHPRLKASIALSRAGQRLILEGDKVSVPPCDNAAVVPHYRTRFKVIEFAVFCRPGDTRNYDAFKRTLG